MDQRFTDGVKNAWRFAIAEAQKLGSEYVGVEHLLMGIASEKDSAGGKILHSLELPRKRLNSCLEELIPASLTANCTLRRVRRGCWNWQLQKLMNWEITM